MFCPKCSQQQISEEVRYCSRCGFELAAVSDALRHKGRSGVSAADAKKTAVIGFGLVTLSALFLLATLIIGTPEPSFIVQMNLLVAALVYLSALGYVYLKLRTTGRDGSEDPGSRNTLPEPDNVPTTKKLLDEPDPSSFVAPTPSFQARPKESLGITVTEDTTTLLRED